MQKNSAEKMPYILFTLACCLGATLRLYLLPSQLLLDDEWHSLNQVLLNQCLGKNLWEVVTQINPRVNTSPLFNLYDYLLYHTVGWSEILLRLPVLIAGLLMVIALPLMVKRVLPGRTWLFFAFLTAISPILVFYSRHCRPYSFMALLGFAALFAACRWLESGERKHAIIFAVLVAFGVYVHPFSIILVGVPLVATLFGLINRRSDDALLAVMPAGKVISLTVALGAVCMFLLWPLLRSSAKLPWKGGDLSMGASVTAWTLISGTANIPLNILFALLYIAGLLILMKKRPVLARLFLVTICCYLAALLVSRPAGVDTAAVFLRYMIVAVPVVLATVAVAIDALLQWISRRQWGSSAALFAAFISFLLLLYLGGPLPQIYSSPNNFTNHSAFQGAYGKLSWQRAEAHCSYTDLPLTADNLPPFYRWLKLQGDVTAIIEYPFDICNFNNPFYFFQHVHRKRVLAGYTADPALLGYQVIVPDDRPYTPCLISIDDILVGGRDKRKLAFRNMVDVTDKAAVARSGADVVVLHKYLPVLRLFPDGQTDFASLQYASVQLLYSRFESAYGKPVYEDGEIVCFRLKRPRS